MTYYALAAQMPNIEYPTTHDTSFDPKSKKSIIMVVDNKKFFIRRSNIFETAAFALGKWLSVSNMNDFRGVAFALSSSGDYTSSVVDLTDMIELTTTAESQ